MELKGWENKMPTEDKEQTKTWKIEFVGFEDHNGYEQRIVFEVTNPNSEIKVIRPKFKMRFINDYFSTSGKEDSIKAVKENEALFKTWGLVKIEEIISADFNETEPDIADFKWAKKVDDHQLRPSSRQENANVFYYLPEYKMGFHN